MRDIEMLPVGGRIKAAMCGMDHLYQTTNVVELNNALAKLRKKPSHRLLSAFFPSDIRRLKQMMRGIGFYRPVLKTDQGMAGNFFPFLIDQKLSETDFIKRQVIAEEGITVFERWYDGHNSDVMASVQKSMLDMDLHGTYSLLTEHYQHDQRRAEKGRTPFFFIRPGMLDDKVIFGRDVINKVTSAVQQELEKISAAAQGLEKRMLGCSRPANMIYCQPDVYVLSDGRVAVERINMPDLGFFLTELDCPDSQLLPAVRDVVFDLREKVCEKIACLGSRIALVTRDEVLDSQQDILEAYEIESLKKTLAEKNIILDVFSQKNVSSIPIGMPTLLLNIDYRDDAAQSIIERHYRGEIECFPNPFFQMTAQRNIGLPGEIISERYKSRFLQLAGSVAKKENGVEDTITRLKEVLSSHCIDSDIIYACTGEDMMAVFTKSMHAWRQFASRAKRNNLPITLYQVPANPSNLIIDSASGSRLHVFRFMFINQSL